MTSLTYQTPNTPYPVLQFIKRAAIIAVVLGSILTALNQPGAVFGTATLDLPQMAAVFITPFLVVTLSQFFGTRAARYALAQSLSVPDGFVATLLSNGILARAIAVGIVAAALNTGLSLALAASAGQGGAQLPVALIAQALALPTLFGALSQTLSFRRAFKGPD